MNIHNRNIYKEQIEEVEQLLEQLRDKFLNDDNLLNVRDDVIMESFESFEKPVKLLKKLLDI